jgi:hypothetical protein
VTPGVPRPLREDTGANEIPAPREGAPTVLRTAELVRMALLLERARYLDTSTFIATESSAPKNCRWSCRERHRQLRVRQVISQAVADDSSEPRSPLPTTEVRGCSSKAFRSIASTVPTTRKVSSALPDDVRARSASILTS